MKINWQNVLEFVIAFSIASILTQFVLEPVADWAYGKIKPAFEAMVS